MRDYIELGSAPAEEECVQVSRDGDYLQPIVEECKRYRDLLRKTFGDEPASARLSIKHFPHDFGTYCEVVCSFDDEDEEAQEYAFKLESEAPLRWN